MSVTAPKSRKCYMVRESNTGFSEIVFAETASKARYIAWNNSDEWFEGMYYHFIEFCRNIEVTRCHEGDKWCKVGKRWMDWSDDQDRIELVKELGWYCVNEDDIDCEECAAKEFCCRYEYETREGINQL